MNLGHPCLDSIFLSLLIFGIFLPNFILLAELMGSGTYDPVNLTVTSLCAIGN